MLLDNLLLPDDLIWVNEFDWNAVEQSVERSLNGALLVQEMAKQKGQSIELNGENSGWLTRAQVLELQLMAQSPNKIMTLILADGREFSVIFDRSAPPVFAEPIFPEALADSAAPYAVVLRFLTV